jgi:L-lactate dehydrogenase
MPWCWESTGPRRSTPGPPPGCEAVTYSNISIIEGIGACQHGIGAVVGQITEAIADDSHAIMPVASYREEYGTFVGLPTVLGRGGAVRVLVPELTPQEQEQLDASAAILREADRIAFESAGL